MSRHHIREVIRYAESNGWRVTRTNKNHLRFEGHGRTIFSGSTPSDQRVQRNLMADLKRAQRHGEKK